MAPTTRNFKVNGAAPTHVFSDSLARLRNAMVRHSPHATVRANKLVVDFFKVLQRAGYIRGVEKIPLTGLARVLLKYNRQGSVIRVFQLVSGPLRPVRVGVDRLHALRGAPGVLVLSTHRGVLTDEEARAAHVGGLVLAYIERSNPILL